MEVGGPWEHPLHCFFYSLAVCCKWLDANEENINYLWKCFSYFSVSEEIIEVASGQKT